MAEQKFIAGFRILLTRDVKVPSADEMLRDDISSAGVDDIVQSFPPAAREFIRAELAKDAAALDSASPVTESDVVDALIATLAPFPAASSVMDATELTDDMEHRDKMITRNKQLKAVHEWISKVGKTVLDTYTGKEYYDVTKPLVTTFFVDKEIPLSVDILLHVATNYADTPDELLTVASMGGGAGRTEDRLRF